MVAQWGRGGCAAAAARHDQQGGECRVQPIHGQFNLSLLAARKLGGEPAPSTGDASPVVERTVEEQRVETQLVLVGFLAWLQ